jgi:hypothetical protein
MYTLTNIGIHRTMTIGMTERTASYCARLLAVSVCYMDKIDLKTMESKLFGLASYPSDWPPHFPTVLYRCDFLPHSHDQYGSKLLFVATWALARKPLYGRGWGRWLILRKTYWSDIQSTFIFYRIYRRVACIDMIWLLSFKDYTKYFWHPWASMNYHNYLIADPICQSK